MNANTLDLATATSTERIAPLHTLAAMAIALATGALALVYPPAAVLALAALAARALLSVRRIGFRLVGVIAPLAASAGAGALIGLPAAIGMLFAWRVWADTYWSVEQLKRRALAAGRPDETRLHALAHAWLTPAYGFALVAYSSPHMVAGLPLDLPHVPLWAPLIVGGLAAGALLDQALRRSAELRLGQLAAGPTAHMLAHHTIFLAAFGLMLDVSAGIVALLAWRLAHAAPAWSFSRA